MAEEIARNGNGAAPSHSNLFVGNVAEGATEDVLKSAFAPFGDIESVLLTSKAGRPSGFVKMVDVESASRAVAGLSSNSFGWEVKFAKYDIGKAPKFSDKGFGKGFGGYGWWPKGMGKGAFGGKYGGWTFVKGGYGKGTVPELREDDGPEKPEPPQSDNLYVKHLPIGTTEENLQETFSPCGEVAEVRILRPQFAVECAALVRFATADGAEKARNSLDGTCIQGTTSPLYANTQTKGSDSKKDHVYVKNVPTNTSEEKIKAIIEKHGTVKWSKVMRASAGQSRVGATCAALFEMSSEEEASAVIAELNDKSFSLGELCGPMRVRYAENKAASKVGAEGQIAEPPPPPPPPATSLAA